MQSTINMLKSSDLSTDVRGKEERLANAFQFFNDQVKREGAESTEAISAAVILASSFSLAGHGIEAERLITKYAPISHRVHGDEHRITKDAESVLDVCKSRFVVLENGEEFKALKYEDGGNKCIVQGPVVTRELFDYPDRRGGTTVYTVDCSSLLFVLGTPVICQGLQKSAHFNGKLADARSFDKDKERYTIHFEDTSLKPVAAKKENVRIAFDLSDVE